MIERIRMDQWMHIFQTPQKLRIHKENVYEWMGSNTYLLLAECEVRTASYGPSFFPSFYGHENKEGKNKIP